MIVQTISENGKGNLMNSCTSTRQTGAFTLIELFVILVILALLFATLVPAVALSKRKAQRIKCTNNLKQIGTSFRLFSTDHGDKYPETTSTNKSGAREYLWQSNFAARYFSMLSNELATPKNLLCPTGNRKAAINYAALSDANVSYFAGLDADETRPQALLAGDRNLTINGVEARGDIVEIHPTDQLGWSKAMHRYSGNVALGDEVFKIPPLAVRPVLFETYAKKYPERWKGWEKSFRDGLKDGSRVLIRYDPK